MLYAVHLPNFGDYGDARLLADLAREAEDAGWDGFFVCDQILYRQVVPIVDPWLALTAAALVTTRIKLGPMVTPLPRRRPWIVARQSVTLDHLSDGRLIQGVGLGDDLWQEFSRFGESVDQRLHGAMLDEALAVLTGLWSGEQFQFAGQHYHLKETVFLPRPTQHPRIRLWCAGFWPGTAPFRRAARWDGIFPLSHTGYLSPTDVVALVAYIDRYRHCQTIQPASSSIPFDVAIGGETSGSDPIMDRDHMATYAAAGATWWLEQLNRRRGPLAEMRRRLRAGPPI